MESAQMSMPTRIEARLGLALFDLVRRYQLRKMAVRVNQHRDAKGRVTPWLEVGAEDGPTLVWLHGFSDRPEGFLRTAAHLTAEFRIVAPALPAFHEGWRDPDEVHTITAFADWLLPVIEQAAPASYVLIGNSLGGAVALEVASRRPAGLTGLLAVNSAGMAIDGLTSVADEVARGDSPFEIRRRKDVGVLFGRIFGREVRIPFPFEAALYKEYAREADWYRRVGTEVGGSEPRLFGDGWRSAIDLRAIAVPTLVLWGVNDRLFPRAHAERMAEVIDDGRLEWLDGIGHSPHLERPQALAESVRRFALSL